jgi:hypothetical protein
VVGEVVAGGGVDGAGLAGAVVLVLLPELLVPPLPLVLPVAAGGVVAVACGAVVAMGTTCDRTDAGAIGTEPPPSVPAWVGATAGAA